MRYKKHEPHRSHTGIRKTEAQGQEDRGDSSEDQMKKNLTPPNSADDSYETRKSEWDKQESQSQKKNQKRGAEIKKVIKRSKMPPPEAW